MERLGELRQTQKTTRPHHRQRGTCRPRGPELHGAEPRRDMRASAFCAIVTSFVTRKEFGALARVECHEISSCYGSFNVGALALHAPGRPSCAHRGTRVARKNWSASRSRCPRLSAHRRQRLARRRRGPESKGAGGRAARRRASPWCPSTPRAAGGALRPSASPRARRRPCRAPSRALGAGALGVGQPVASSIGRRSGLRKTAPASEGGSLEIRAGVGASQGSHFDEHLTLEHLRARTSGPFLRLPSWGSPTELARPQTYPEDKLSARNDGRQQILGTICRPRLFSFEYKIRPTSGRTRPSSGQLWPMLLGC